jgi:hypothetical protein
LYLSTQPDCVGFTWSSASSHATFEAVVFEELVRESLFEDVIKDIFEEILEDAVEDELDTFEFFRIELGAEQLLFLLIFNRVRSSDFGIVAIESEIIELWSTSDVGWSSLRYLRRYHSSLYYFELLL